MERKRTKQTRRTARTPIMKRLGIDPSKPLPQPDLKPPERPRLLGEPVLNRIANACNVSQKEMDIPWSGEALRVTLRDCLTEFEAASMLVQRAIVRDRSAEMEFRAWLARATAHSPGIKRYQINLERIRNHPLGVRPFNLVSLETFRALFVGAVMIARDENDLNNLIRGIDACFARAKWGESLYQAAQNFEQTGDAHSFASRLRMFGRMTGMGPGRYGYSRNRSTPPDWGGEIPIGREPVPELDDLSIDLGPVWPPPDRIKQFEEDLARLDTITEEDVIMMGLDFAYSVLRHLAVETHVSLRAMYYPIPADSDYLLSDNIMNIMPRHTCGGQPITISGYDFGQPQPAAVGLVFPFHIAGELPPGIPRTVSRIAEVPGSPDGQWSNNQIVLPCPEWARYGPVGFLDLTALEVYADAAQFVGDVFFEGRASKASRRLQDLMEVGNVYGILGSGTPEVIILPLPVFPLPPLTDHNLFEGTTPEIEISTADHIVIEPGQTVMIHWRVIGAKSGEDSISISTRGAFAEGVPQVQQEHQGGDFVNGTLELDFSVNFDNDWEYTFTARNDCGEVNRTVTVHVRRPTQVTIYGIEIIQAIQSFNKDDPSLTNAIPLVEGKIFSVRAYAGSGWPAGYGSISTGWGQVQMLLGQVTATMDLVPLSGQSWMEVLNYPLSNEVFLPKDNNLGGPEIKFYPWYGYATGEVQIRIRLSSNDPWAAWEPVEKSVTVEFLQTDNIKLHIFEVVDEDDVRPTPNEIDTSLEKLRAIFPVAYEDGIQCVGTDTLYTDLDLNKDDDWYHYSLSSEDLFDKLNEAAEEITNDDVIPCGIVSVKSRNKDSGRGWPGGLTKNRLAYWRADPEKNSFIEAHEIGHTLNLDENDDVNINIPGIDFHELWSPREIPPTTDTMMDPCSNERWIQPGEYLWVMGWSSQRILQYCVDNSLYCNIATYYFD